MNNNTLPALILSFLFVGYSHIFAAGTPIYTFPKAKLTARVIDEESKPVEGAEVRISFDQPTPKYGTVQPATLIGDTDMEGLFFGEGYTDGDLGGSVRKDGYYKSSLPLTSFKEANDKRQWQPWNPTVQTTLRPIINPIPMYAKKLNMAVPSFETLLGFDFEKGDWTAPHGKGINTDVVFLASKEERGDRKFNYSLNVSFPNQGDGIQSFEKSNFSFFRSPYNAPLDGYQPEYVQFRNRTSPKTPEENNLKPDGGYFLRVRTQLDDQGKPIKCNYVKIYGDFLQFSYYFNPNNNDPNVEFDTKRNLFTNLDSSEKVSMP